MPEEISLKSQLFAAMSLYFGAVCRNGVRVVTSDVQDCLPSSTRSILVYSTLPSSVANETTINTGHYRVLGTPDATRIRKQMFGVNVKTRRIGSWVDMPEPLQLGAAKQDNEY